MGWIAAYCALWLLLTIAADRISARTVRLSTDTAGAPHRSPARAEGGPWPDITVIKPVRGADEFSEANFRSWLSQDYPAQVQVIFSLQDPQDTALPILRALGESFQFELIVNPIREGFGGKTSNLFHGLAHAKHDLLVMSDGDILAPPDTLRRIAAIMGTGERMVGCLPCHIDARNLWAQIYAYTWNSAVITIWGGSMLWGRPLGVPGATIALSRANLDRLGGMAAFADFLAEDVAMGQAALRAGLQVTMGPRVTSPVGRMPFRSLLEKLKRGVLAARLGAPPGTWPFALAMIVTTGYGAILIAGLVLADVRLLGAGLLLTLCDGVAQGRLAALAGGRFRFAWYAPLTHGLNALMLVVSVFDPTVTWAGVRYRASRGGRITRID